MGLDLPYADLWVPLLIGMAVGTIALTGFHWLAGPRRAAPEQPKPEIAPAPPLPDLPPGHDPFVHGSTADQRGANRRKGRMIAVSISLAEGNGPSWQGRVLDRSVGGLCLASDREMGIGALLRVLPTEAPPLTPWVEVAVRSCRQGEGGFQLGCQFVKAPPWSIMLMFG